MTRDEAINVLTDLLTTARCDYCFIMNEVLYNNCKSNCDEYKKFAEAIETLEGGQDNGDQQQ